MPKQTEAAVLFELGKPLCLTTLAIPSLKPGQVLVDVAYSGVCHTQLLEVQGKRGVDRFLPHTLGHEGAGVVLETGEGVRKVKAGDHVVLSWIKGKGADIPSTVYQSSSGTVNSGALSTFMNKSITCESRVVPIPGEMPLREAALLGCAVPTGSGIIRNTARVEKGSSIAIFGIGGIGLSVLLAARLSEPSLLIAVDIVQGKLDLAQRLGATHVIHGLSQDPEAVILEITQGRGVDYSIEAAGQRETMEQAFRAIREQGGLCVLAGNLPAGDLISIDPFSLIKGKRIVGTWGGETNPDQDIPEYIDLYRSGKMNLGALITQEYRLEEVNRALQDLEQGKVGRGVIKF